jgi:transaldolase
MMNPLQSLQQFGQSVWLDSIDRKLLETGELKRLIDEDGVTGLTSNPAIFEKAISSGVEYDAAIQKLKSEGKLAGPKDLYERLAIQDIRDAADLLMPVYEATSTRDGYVSLEVSPHLAADTEGTIEEARRLWKAVDRPNLMVKVPGTPEGVPAIKHLASEGINVNVTLLFSQEAYEAVARAWIDGLEIFSKRGGDLRRPASVASFFISRIDTLVDSLAEKRLAQAEQPSERAMLKHLQGKVAIANAKQAYQRYKKFFSGSRWETLAKKGAKPQRLLWASTSTKNPEYRDVIYVEELIGPNTVNTMPPVTLAAFRDHGAARSSIEESLKEADEVIASLARSGLVLREVTDQLLMEAVALFVHPFDKLLASLERKLTATS